MQVSVDRALCQGHAQCEDVAPEIFEVRDDGFAHVLLANLNDPSLCAKAEEAALRCPADAVILESVE